MSYDTGPLPAPAPPPPASGPNARERAVMRQKATRDDVKRMLNAAFTHFHDRFVSGKVSAQELDERLALLAKEMREAIDASEARLREMTAGLVANSTATSVELSAQFTEEACNTVVEKVVKDFAVREASIGTALDLREARHLREYHRPPWWARVIIRLRYGRLRKAASVSFDPECDVCQQRLKVAGAPWRTCERHARVA